MPRKRVDDGIPVRAPRIKRGVKPYLPLLILVGVGLALVVGGCGFLAHALLTSLGGSTSDGIGTKETYTGAVSQFALGYNPEFYQDKSGNMQIKKMKPALTIRTKDGVEIDCLFAADDARIYKLKLGDRITVKGEYVPASSKYGTLHNCQMTD